MGTDRGGDTYPGAQAPFGMVHLVPIYRVQGYDYNEPSMHGFALTLMSGPGGANGGTPFFTATAGPVQIDEANYSYSCDHKHESASAGYHQVLMQRYGINADLTAPTRCGMARFTFPAGKQANVLLPISFANVTTYASKVDGASRTASKLRHLPFPQPVVLRATHTIPNPALGGFAVRPAA